jgi:hypothetical protein
MPGADKKISRKDAKAQREEESMSQQGKTTKITKTEERIKKQISFTQVLTV